MKTADSVPLQEFSLIEKLALMDRLWEELSRQPEAIPSPEWHGEILTQRLADLETGKTSFLDWEDAKKRLLSRFD